jgi:hypothetical protein
MGEHWDLDLTCEASTGPRDCGGWSGGGRR